MAVIDAGPDHLALWTVAVEALDLWVQWCDRRPFRGECPKCGRGVVVVSLFGEDTVLEVVEVLPLMRCPRCASNVAQGRLGSDVRARGCARCGDSRVVGQEVPSVGVAVSGDGSARPFTGDVLAGEAIHLPHVCLDAPGIAL